MPFKQCCENCLELTNINSGICCQTFESENIHLVKIFQKMGQNKSIADWECPICIGHAWIQNLTHMPTYAPNSPEIIHEYRTRKISVCGLKINPPKHSSPSTSTKITKRFFKRREFSCLKKKDLSQRTLAFEKLRLKNHAGVPYRTFPNRR